MAFAKHLRAQPAACGDAEPVRLALAAAIEEAATYQKRPIPGRVRAINERRSVLVDEFTQNRRSTSHYRPEERVVGELLGERKRSSEGTGGDGAAVVPVPSGSSALASAMNIQAPGGIPSPPPTGGGGCVEGIASPQGRLRRGLPQRAGLSPTGCGRLRAPPGRERRGRGVRRVPVDSRRRVRLSMSRGRRRRRSHGTTADPSGCVRRQVRPVEAAVLNLVEPADAHLVQVFVRLEPRDRLVDCPKVKVGPTARRPRRPAVSRSERAQAVHDREQLEDGRSKFRSAADSLRLSYATGC